MHQRHKRGSKAWIRLREFSSENFDYYRITDERLCSLCELEYGDKESIEGTYKAKSYLIKCEQREIEIVA
ncbi:hypothetical protein RclHR1_18660004 [Rhizophagus clarus]|uniref:Uncharacterized protein n=1 Tax=Rhizophagus clarus TaxID=94130 RepID=A0A2Z6QRZ7_9GLOM|nr:hypothetical protein RclHR1_18660004 [Rhizophagus clarus]